LKVSYALFKRKQMKVFHPKHHISSKQN